MNPVSIQVVGNCICHACGQITAIMDMKFLRKLWKIVVWKLLCDLKTRKSLLTIYSPIRINYFLVLTLINEALSS